MNESHHSEMKKNKINKEDDKIYLRNLDGNHKGSKVRFVEFIESERKTFLDYIKNGYELNFSVAIDFTYSNGDPRDHTSLHTLNMDNNQYFQTIKALGSIL